MLHHSTANIDPFLSTLPTAPWDVPDPLPVMRREMKLLLIEVTLLRTEVQQLAAQCAAGWFTRRKSADE